MLDLSTRGLREDGGNCLKYLNPIQDGHFRGCSRWGEGVGQKSVTYPTMMKLGTVIPYLKKIQKIYESHDTSLSSADVSIFLLEISKVCYIKKYRYRLHFDTEFLTILTFLESSEVALINMVKILMSAKMATPGLLKMKVF